MTYTEALALMKEGEECRCGNEKGFWKFQDGRLWSCHASASLTYDQPPKKLLRSKEWVVDTRKSYWVQGTQERIFDDPRYIPGEVYVAVRAENPEEAAELGLPQLWFVKEVSEVKEVEVSK
jgi:hypothetical protein